jgi:Uma2 family endonuclease
VSTVPNHIVLYNIPWDAYTKFMDALGAKHVSHVYQKGTLEMMSPTQEHERFKIILRRIVEIAALEFDVPYLNVGSATRRHRKLEHGLEPDESYYIGGESVERAMQKSSGAKRNAPDLAIEVEWSRAVLSKLKSYAVLGVREVWRHHRGKVEFYVLGDDGSYKSVERSAALPLLTTKAVNAYVKQWLQTNDNTAEKTIPAAIKKLRKKS